jgi:hypothetical protein
LPACMRTQLQSSSTLKDANLSCRWPTMDYITTSLSNTGLNISAL